MYFAIGENTAHKYFESDELQAIYRFLQQRFPYRKEGNLFPEPIHIRNDHHNNISPEMQKKLQFIDDAESGKFYGMPDERPSRATKLGILKEVDINDPTIKCVALVYDIKNEGYYLSVAECAKANGMSASKVSSRKDLFKIWRVVEKYKHKKMIGTKNEIKAKYVLSEGQFERRLENGSITLLEKVLEER